MNDVAFGAFLGVTACIFLYGVWGFCAQLWKHGVTERFDYLQSQIETLSDSRFADLRTFQARCDVLEKHLTDLQTKGEKDVCETEGKT